MDTLTKPIDHKKISVEYIEVRKTPTLASRYHRWILPFARHHFAELLEVDSTVLVLVYVLVNGLYVLEIGLLIKEFIWKKLKWKMKLSSFQIVRI